MGAPPMGLGLWPLATLAMTGLFAGACGGSQKRPSPKGPVDLSEVGECVAVEQGGRISAAPELTRADRDLNGDGRAEIVTRDKKLCRGDNCEWNLFSFDGTCYRYIGTIAGAAIETGRSSAAAEQGFTELRSWWRFKGGERALLHVYRFGRGGYRLIETLVCRSVGGDGVECVLEEAL